MSLQKRVSVKRSYGCVTGVGHTSLSSASIRSGEIIVFSTWLMFQSSPLPSYLWGIRPPETPDPHTQTYTNVHIRGRELTQWISQRKGRA
jgi:hypothetical protein